MKTLLALCGVDIALAAPTHADPVTDTWYPTCAVLREMLNGTISRTKKFVVGGAVAGSLMLGAAALVIAAGIAHADTGLADTQYVTCVAQDGLYSTDGPSDTAAGGRKIAYDISSGLRTVSEEQYYVYLHTAAVIQQYDANYMVNCARAVYLGYGPSTSTTPLQVAS
jgi:hypothetical protein